jgi:hypothetical protein
MSNDEVQDLIKQLKNLQLQQTELLVCLERARGNEARAGVYNEEESGIPDGHTSERGGRARGAGRGRGSGRGNRSRRGNGGRSSAPQTFYGNTDGMKRNVFQCHGKSTNKQQFLKTVGVLDEHINKTF